MNRDRTAGSSLSRAITAAEYFTVAFGCVVGVAWVIVLGDIVARAGPAGAALAMAGGGVAILIVAFCYAEVAAARPAAGGELVYAHELAGSGGSFAVGWLLALIYVSACAFEAISIGAVSDLLFPGATGPRLYALFGQDVRMGGVIIGLGAAIALWLLNLAGAALTARSQQWVTYARIALMFIFLGVAIAYGRPANLAPLFRHAATSARLGDILAVLATAPFWFGGFTVFATAAEESASSMRLVGRAIVVSVIAAGVFYVTLILCISALAPWPVLAAMKLPAAQAFKVGVRSPAMAKLVLATALLGNLTAWNALLLAGSRVLFALGRAKLAPDRLARVHPRSHAPSTAIGLVSLISIGALFLGRGFIAPLINVSSAVYCLMYLVTCLTLIRLRRASGGPPAAYAAPGGAATAWLAIAASVAMLAVSLVGPWMASGGAIPPEWLTLAGWSALGAIVWLASARSRAEVSEPERAQLLRGYLTP
ncbi:MAG: APC family permease [Caulobacteraceae bacterium]